MKLQKALLIAIFYCAFVNINFSLAVAFEDNDFAEFEDFDTDDEFIDAPANTKSEGLPSTNELPITKEKDSANTGNVQDDEEDGIVEDEDEFFKDDEEFEGFDGGDAKDDADKRAPEPKLTVAKIPMHFR